MADDAGAQGEGDRLVQDPERSAHGVGTAPGRLELVDPRLHVEVVDRHDGVVAPPIGDVAQHRAVPRLRVGVALGGQQG
jgi:hypothetical protein